MKNNGHESNAYEFALVEAVLQSCINLTLRHGISITHETNLDLIDFTKHLNKQKNALPEMADEIEENFNVNVFKRAFGASQLGSEMLEGNTISFPYKMDTLATREQLIGWRQELDSFVAANTDYSKN